MDNKDLNNVTTRTQRKEIEEAMKKDALEKRKELKKVLFEEEVKTNKNVFLKFILTICLILSIGFASFGIIRALDSENEILMIINFAFVFIFSLALIICFKKVSKGNYKGFIFQGLILIIYMAFNILCMCGIINLPKQDVIPNFANKSLNEAISWADNNNIKYSQVFEYSDEIDKYNVIYQSVEDGSFVKNVNKVKFIVSNGPDFSKEVIIPDFTGTDINEAMKIFKESNLSNISLEFEENDKALGTIISQSASGKIKRSDPLIVRVSIYKKSDLKDFELDDLKGKSLLDASLYLGLHGVSYELNYDFSDTVLKGNVIKSSIGKGSKVNYNDKIVLTISKGKQVKMMDVNNKKLSDVIKWTTLNNLNTEYQEKYDDTVKNGYVIEANYKANEVLEEKDTIILTVSKGVLKMPSVKNVSEFKTWADGNSLKYEIKEEFSDNVNSGEIINCNFKTGDKINGDLVLTVSKGKGVTVPYLIGKSKSEAQKECKNSGITCTFKESYSNQADKVIKQSSEAGSVISLNDTLEVTIGVTKKTSSSNTVSTPNKNTSNSSNNSSNSNSGNNSNNTPQNICKSNTYTINLNNLFNNYSGYDAVYAQLKNLEKEYPGITVNVYGDATSGASAGSFVSGFKRGTVNCPDTISITISK